VFNLNYTYIIINVLNITKCLDATSRSNVDLQHFFKTTFMSIVSSSRIHDSDETVRRVFRRNRNRIFS